MVFPATRTARPGSVAPSPRRTSPRRARPLPGAPRACRASAQAYEALEPRRLLAAVSPTADEQLMIELVNRARANPAQYASDFSLDVPLTNVAARPPLAVSGLLTSSARFHSSEMATRNYFGDVSPVTGDAANKMARDAGYALNAAFSTAQNANNVESITAGINLTGPRPALELLLEDFNPQGQENDPPGHRIHMLGMNDFFAAHDEIGVGHSFNAAAQYDHYWSIQTAYDQNSPQAGKFLTGVAYDDTGFEDRFYSIGEGLGGVTITARRVSDNQTFTTTTWDSGGYSLRLQPGTYTVTGSGGGLPEPITYTNVVMGSQNVKRDFAATADVTAPSAVVLAAAQLDANALPLVFTVRYTDNAGVAVATLDDFDIRVVRPNGQVIPADFLEAGSSPGQGNPVNGDYQILPPGGSWDYTDNGLYQVHVQANQVRDPSGNFLPAGAIGTLTINVTMPGDANRDGRVNSTDFTALAQNFGRAGRDWSQGDFNGDGITNSADFTILAQNFGRSVPAALVSVASAQPVTQAVSSEDTGGATQATAGPSATGQAPSVPVVAVKASAPRVQPASPAGRPVPRAAAPRIMVSVARSNPLAVPAAKPIRSTAAAPLV